LINLRSTTHGVQTQISDSMIPVV